MKQKNSLNLISTLIIFASGLAHSSPVNAFFQEAGSVSLSEPSPLASSSSPNANQKARNGHEFAEKLLSENKCEVRIYDSLENYKLIETFPLLAKNLEYDGSFRRKQSVSHIVDRGSILEASRELTLEFKPLKDNGQIYISLRSIDLFNQNYVSEAVTIKTSLAGTNFGIPALKSWVYLVCN